MTSSKLSIKAVLVAGGIGLSAALAGSQPAAAQSYTCPAGTVYDPSYGCTLPGEAVEPYDYGYYGYLPYYDDPVWGGVREFGHGFAHGMGDHDHGMGFAHAGGFGHRMGGGFDHGVGFAHAGGGFGHGMPGGFHGGGGGHR